jgi:hypothetical protein
MSETIATKARLVGSTFLLVTDSDGEPQLPNLSAIVQVQYGWQKSLIVFSDDSSLEIQDSFEDVLQAIEKQSKR